MVVIGAGAVAARKIQALHAAGARLVVIAKHLDKIFEATCQDRNIELIESKYSKDYLVGACLVIAATNDQQLNKQIYNDCTELEILCNIVDKPEFCDFFVPAVVKQGDLQIAIGTEGNCPAYAGHIRKKLEKIFTEEHGLFLAELEKIRKQIIEDVPDPDQRKALLGRLVDDESFENFKKNGRQAWQSWAKDLIKKT